MTSYTINIKSNLSYEIDALGHNDITLQNPPELTNNKDSIISLLNHVTQLKVCPGNPDEKYIQMAEERKGVFYNQQGWTQLHYFIINNTYLLF